jgi:hypothetical protein
MTILQLIEQPKESGGAIVASSDCSPLEISVAQSTGRFSCDEHGFGYIRRPKEWLRINKNRELAHPNTEGKYN